LRACLVFGPDGIDISAFIAASDDTPEALTCSVSVFEELDKLSFAVCEIESSTAVILASSVAELFISEESDLTNAYLLFLLTKFSNLWHDYFLCSKT